MRAATLAATGDPGSRRAHTAEMRTALAIGWLLVIARSLVYTIFEQAQFDSDQAIVGLMAKHLSEGRAFPLFFYGQAYMLAVESWLAVPYFWIAGPTVAALRASLIGTNLAVVTLLIVGFHRWGGLRPLYGLVAATFFAFVPPHTAADLLEAQGGNIEPFLWVLVLWIVRDRPFWFGSLLAIGFLNREFTVYAVPVLILGQACSGVIWRMATWRTWLFALAAFLAVWQGVQALKPVADLMGPGTRGELLSGQTGSQIENLANRTRMEVTSVPARAWTLVRADVSALMGGRAIVSGMANQGRDWMGWLLAVAAIVAACRIAFLAWTGRGPLRTGAMGWYVLGVGLMAVAGYAVSRPAVDVIRRYLLLSIFIPVGVTAIWLALEPRRLVRHAIVGVVIGWAIFSGVDNWRQFARYASGEVPNDMRVLIAALDARGVTVADAPYWRAYKLSFLTEERIRVASTDFVRIDEYQTIAAAEGANLRHIRESPCPGGEHVAGWYLCRD